jgi:hypothetical protein
VGACACRRRAAELDDEAAGWVEEVAALRVELAYRLSLEVDVERLPGRPVELLADRVTQPELPPDAPQALSADATRLGRILVDLTRQTPVTRLATALGWSLARIQAALDVLEVRLPAVGQRLVHGTGGVQIVRDSPEPDPSVMELVSARINDNGLSPTQAAVPVRVMHGEMTEQAASAALMTNPQRVALAEMVNAGPRHPTRWAPGQVHALRSGPRRTVARSVVNDIQLTEDGLHGHQVGPHHEDVAH